MPTNNVYDEYTVAGKEVSSTYEGRHIQIEESILVHPVHAGDTLVNKGDPVVMDEIVGVAFASADAVTDYIAIDTEGIWALSVIGKTTDGTDLGRDEAIAIGDKIYINKIDGTLSGRKEPADWQPFGYALNEVNAGATTVIAVKVHGQFNPLEQVLIGEFLNNYEIDVAAEVVLGQNNPGIIRVFAGASTAIAAGKKLYGMSMRLENTVVASQGLLVAGEFKAVQNAAAGTLAELCGFKAQIDSPVAGATALAHALYIQATGAGTAPAIRCAIDFESSGTAGVLESLFYLRAFTNFGGSASDTLNTPSGTIAVNVAGAIHFLQLYST